jgi:hypothetical protein
MVRHFAFYPIISKGVSMEMEYFTTQMSKHAGAIRSMTLYMTEEQARWKPEPNSWSILEVINHLYDEERLDFRVRLEIILFHPEKQFPPINPEGWVNEKGYNQRDLIESVENFLQERRKSLEWLRSLDTPDWQAFVEAPFGKLAAGDMMSSWAAHDLLHLRQLVELDYGFMLKQVGRYKPDYAGEW